MNENSEQRQPCPDCGELDGVNRRQFLQVATATVAAGAMQSGVFAADPANVSATTAVEANPIAAETIVKRLYETLSDKQKKEICFGWDFQQDQRGLLRTYISNNWNVTKPYVASDFYTGEQQALVRDIFEGMIQPDWHQQIDKQLQDDAGGFGKRQSIALFGRPGEGNFEFVMTGRHMTLRCDGNSADHVAFGGPIFYGHAAQGFNEAPDHPGNVFWPQAVAANNVYKMLDGRQRKLALVAKSPSESAVAFRQADQQRPGIPVTELSQDQKEHVQKVLDKLIEPYRQDDRDEVLKCLKAKGGLDSCSLAFYSDPDIGNDGVWDNWRLEGPAFVWYFRGEPHVHVWVNVASSADVKLNA
ncbi:MAG: DUF3500 domain-containing protein [Pirellulales bacterium]|nr:DUF3500 domain-containing protein [Pirellulales bacterium]